MTLIEFFDSSPLQNIAGCLSIKPSHLILVGDGAKVKESEELYRKILKEKGFETVVSSKSIPSGAVDDAVDDFVKLIKKHSPCVIDLFGGNENHNAAASIAYHLLKDTYDVSLQQVDLSEGYVINYSSGGVTVMGEKPTLSVRESVLLNGGVVFKEEEQPSRNYSSKDIEGLWSIAKKNPSLWNKKLSALNLIEKRAENTQKDKEVFVDLNNLVGTIPDKAQTFSIYRKFIGELARVGAITLAQQTGIIYRYRYKNDLVLKCLEKEGNLLEHKTFFEMREYAPNNQPFFNDCLMGVMLDWDGVLHNPNGPDVRDTRNEIDVMAMRGAIPVFVSCKNGIIPEEEPYKLSIVSQKLGGEFAKMMLVSTDYEPGKETTKQTLITRLKDMKILFEPDAARMEKQDWHNLFEKLFD